MNPSSVTQDNAIAVTLGYLYGADSLVKIRVDETGVTYTFSVPEEDVKIIVEDYEGGKLAIADLLAWFREQSRIRGTLSAMKRRNESQWTSRYWIRGIDANGNKIA